jgi:hypothetical protein
VLRYADGRLDVRVAPVTAASCQRATKRRRCGEGPHLETGAVIRALLEPLSADELSGFPACMATLDTGAAKVPLAEFLAAQAQVRGQHTTRTPLKSVGPAGPPSSLAAPGPG